MLQSHDFHRLENFVTRITQKKSPFECDNYMQENAININSWDGVL